MTFMRLFSVAVRFVGLPALVAAIALLAVVVSSGSVGAVASQQPQSEGDGQRVQTGAANIVGFSERLAALTPSGPAGYVQLADEVATESTGRDDRDLARQLYALAVHLDMASPPGTANRGVVAQSACFGLAGLTRRTAERRWLLSIVEIVDSDPLSLRRRLPRALASLPEVS